MSGTISALKLERGFGFITAPGQPSDIYFHVSDLAEGLEFDEQLRGRRVVFDLRETERGARAVNVQAATD